MKATRNIIPMLLVLVVLVGAGFVAYVIKSRGGAAQQAVDVVDNGPNAGLSNIDLVNKAVTNMRQLQSYHVEFDGLVWYVDTWPARATSDVQLRGPGDWRMLEDSPLPGSKFKISIAAVIAGGEPQAVPKGQTGWETVEVVWAPDGKFYSKGFGVENWSEMSGDEVMFLDLFSFVYPWWIEEYWGVAQTDGTPVPQASSRLDYKDGSPRLEVIEGTLTRHVVADVTDVLSEYAPWHDPASEVHMWLSTDATPKVHKLVVNGTWSGKIGPQPRPTTPPEGVIPETVAEEVARTEPYTLTWTWSRFDEDLGMVAVPGEEPGPQESPIADGETWVAEPVLPFRTQAAAEYLDIVDNIAVSSDGQIIATGSWVDKHTQIAGTERYTTTITSTVSLRRVDDWQLITSLVRHDYIDNLWLTPDGTSLIVSTGSTMEWVSVPDGAVTRQLTGLFYHAAFSPDWTTIATVGSEDQTTSENQVVILSAGDGSVVQAIPGAVANNGLEFSPDGQLLVTAGFSSFGMDLNDYVVQLWRVSDGTLLQTLAEGEAYLSWSDRLAFSPDGQVLAWADWDGDVRLYRASDGALLHTLRFGSVEDITFSPDGRLVAASSDRNAVKLWRVSNGTLLAELVNEEGKTGDGGKVFDVEFSPNGKVVYGSTSEGTVRMWEVP
jgi:sugar lactone lactonase YvrE